jgi:peptidoglycan/LPS O-acetylase OafA/YrhL
LTATLPFGIARVGFSFLAGILICRLRHRLRVPRLHWSVSIALVGLLLALPVPEDAHWIYDPVCVIVLFPALILAGAASAPVNPRLVQVFAWMGGASYALYAIHMPFAEIAEYLGETYSKIPHRVFGIGLMIVSVVLAFALDQLFDIPFRRWLTVTLARRSMTASEVKSVPPA